MCVCVGVHTSSNASRVKAVVIGPLLSKFVRLANLVPRRIYAFKFD